MVIWLAPFFFKCKFVCFQLNGEYFAFNVKTPPPMSQINQGFFEDSKQILFLSELYVSVKVFFYNATSKISVF